MLSFFFNSACILLVSFIVYKTVNFLLFDLTQNQAMPATAAKYVSKQKVKGSLIETVTRMCRSAFKFDREIKVEGLIGITVDKRDIILVSINEKLTHPVDNSAAVDTDVPHLEATSLEEYFNPANGDVLRPLKRKRCRSDRAESVHGTTVQTHTGTPSLHTAKLDARSSESLPGPAVTHIGGESGNNLEDVDLQSLVDTWNSGKEIAEYPQSLHGPGDIRCNVTLENPKSATRVNSDTGTDTVQLQCRQDSGVNSERYPSAECCRSNDTAAAADDDNNDDYDDDNKLSISDHHRASDPDNHSIVDDSSRLIISDVFSVKEEPMFDDEYKPSPVFTCGFIPDSVVPGEKQVCRIPDQVPAAAQSSPLQVV